MSKKKTIYIDDNEVAWVKSKPELWRYKKQYLAFIDKLPDGSYEMAYCDENGNIVPDSPRVISLPGLTDVGCIRQID